ncbi:MAG TPA: sigma-70 family RNA polymerase sigma factor, partial [Ktedonobacterales bacterium]|nr:sigma-70 family RNA polymerase sigma factor [Ktedonobacterales bacterium]
MPDIHTAASASLPLSPAGFTALVYQWEGALYGFLCGLIGNTEQAHDLTQDVFQDAWRVTQRGETPFTQGTPQEVMRRWLFQAAYHRAISAMRRRRRIHWESLEESNEREPELFVAPATFEDEVAEREALQAALARLAPQDVACLLLRIAHGFSAAETGEIVGASPQSIDTRLARAKRRLRAVYTQEAP